MSVQAPLLAVALSAALGMGSAASAQSMSRALVGAWRLVSTEQRLSDGTSRPSPLYGSGGVGYLIYTDSGRMCALLTDPSRAKWKSSGAPTEAELRSTFDHFVAYCGRYEVNETQGFVVHHVEMDVVPNSVGTDLKRYASLEGNRLKLRPAEQLPEGVTDYTLTWERVDGPLADPAKR